MLTDEAFVFVWSASLKTFTQSAMQCGKWKHATVTHTHTDLHLPQRLWSYQVSYRWWVGVIKTLMSDKKKRSSLHDKMLARRCRHHAFSDLWPLHQSFIVEAKIKKMGGKKKLLGNFFLLEKCNRERLSHMLLEWILCSAACNARDVLSDKEKKK